MKDLVQFLPFALLVVVFWLLVLRPARKRQQEFAATQRALSPGDRVMLASGIFGTLTSVSDDEVGLEVAPGVTIRVARPAVARVLDDSPAIVEEES